MLASRSSKPPTRAILWTASLLGLAIALGVYFGFGRGQGSAASPADLSGGDARDSDIATSFDPAPLESPSRPGREVVSEARSADDSGPERSRVRIRGIIRQSIAFGDNEPLSGVTVAIVREGASVEEAAQSVVTDASGVYEVTLWLSRTDQVRIELRDPCWKPLAVEQRTVDLSHAVDGLIDGCSFTVSRARTILLDLGRAPVPAGSEWVVFGAFKSFANPTPPLHRQSRHRYSRESPVVVQTVNRPPLGAALIGPSDELLLAHWLEPRPGVECVLELPPSAALRSSASEPTTILVTSPAGTPLPEIPVVVVPKSMRGECDMGSVQVERLAWIDPGEEPAMAALYRADASGVVRCFPTGGDWVVLGPHDGELDLERDPDGPFDWRAVFDGPSLAVHLPPGIDPARRLELTIGTDSLIAPGTRMAGERYYFDLPVERAHEGLVHVFPERLPAGELTAALRDDDSNERLGFASITVDRPGESQTLYLQREP